MRLWELLGERADYNSRALYRMVHDQPSHEGPFARPLNKGWILEIVTNPNDSISMYAYESVQSLSHGKFVESAEDYSPGNLDALVNKGLCVRYNNRTNESVINELFNKPVPYQMHKIDDNMVVAGFKVGPLKYISYFARGHKAGVDFWDFTFEFAESEDGRDSKSDNNTENTGLGGEFVVFATVVNIMKEFINSYKPAVLKFSGDTGNGRGKLYKIMAAKMQTQVARMGYHLESSDLFGASYFTMTRNDMNEGIFGRKTHTLSAPTERLRKAAAGSNIDADDRKAAADWVGRGTTSASKKQDDDLGTVVRDPRPARTFGKRKA